MGCVTVMDMDHVAVTGYGLCNKYGYGPSKQLLDMQLITTPWSCNWLLETWS